MGDRDRSALGPGAVSPPDYGEYRLPHGRHGLTREEVAASQRWRLIGAASELLAEGRLAGLTSRAIAARARVSRYTFYEHFADVDDLLAESFALAARLLVEAVAGACEAGEGPAGHGAAAVGAALSLGAEEAGLVSLMRTELTVAIPGLAAQRDQLVGRLEALLLDGCGGEIRAEGKAARAAALAATLAVGVDQLQAEGPTASAAAELGALLS
jgi:AcrR family transcriptional regulator